MKNARLLTLPLTLALFACATTNDRSTPADEESTATTLARDLVDEAEQRTDMRAMRAAVQGIHEASASLPGTRDALADELESELIVALSEDIHVFDDRLDGASPRGYVDADLQTLKSSGVTHVVVGEYALRGDEVLLSVRMVDTETRMIVAAQKGEIPLESLSERARERPQPVVLPISPPLGRSPAAPSLASSEPAATRTPALGTPSASDPSTNGTSPVEPLEVAARVPASEASDLTRVLPGAEDAGPPEDFATWQAQQPQSEVDLASQTTPPWRTPELARLLEVPSPFETYRKAANSVQPWRTEKLRELLRIPKK